jgi:hypothetical protein
MVEIVKPVNYGGKRHGQLRGKLAELPERCGNGAVALAFSELTMADPATNLTVLRPEARRLCGQLLGPAPEDPYYSTYWEGRTPPAAHKPPPPEVEEADDAPFSSTARRSCSRQAGR